jgi:hypothetical protein
MQLSRVCVQAPTAAASFIAPAPLSPTKTPRQTDAKKDVLAKAKAFLEKQAKVWRAACSTRLNPQLRGPCFNCSSTHNPKHASSHLIQTTSSPDPQERDALLSKRKSTNRELEKTSNVAAGAVPSGDKPWERVLR